MTATDLTLLVGRSACALPSPRPPSPCRCLWRPARAVAVGFAFRFFLHDDVERSVSAQQSQQLLARRRRRRRRTRRVAVRRRRHREGGHWPGQAPRPAVLLCSSSCSLHYSVRLLLRLDRLLYSTRTHRHWPRVLVPPKVKVKLQNTSNMEYNTLIRGVVAIKHR